MSRRTIWGDEIPDEFDARREGRSAHSSARNPYDNFGVSRAEEDAHDAWARGHRSAEIERQEEREYEERMEARRESERREAARYEEEQREFEYQRECEFEESLEAAEAAPPQSAAVDPTERGAGE